MGATELGPQTWWTVYVQYGEYRKLCKTIVVRRKIKYIFNVCTFFASISLVHEGVVQSRNGVTLQAVGAGRRRLHDEVRAGSLGGRAGVLRAAAGVAILRGVLPTFPLRSFA